MYLIIYSPAVRGYNFNIINLAILESGDDAG